MGGMGSGRHPDYGRDTADGCRSLDVNRLHREGCLTPGWWGSWQWSRDGDKVASIVMHMEPDRLVLTYRYRFGDSDWEDVEETVRIVRVPCRFGGSRPYFRCPGIVNGVACGRRVAKLYGPGRYFLCRHCYRLTYTSQGEGDWDRALRRTNKIRARLGGEPGMTTPIPERPKGMWRRTYGRLCREAERSEARANQLFLYRTARFVPDVDPITDNRRHR